MKRRTFFRLIAGGACIAVTGIPKIAEANIPTLHADGVTCDAAALQALFDGKPVNFAQPELARHIYWKGKTLHLQGTFATREPIEIQQAATFSGGVFKPETTLFDVRDVGNCTFTEMVFDLSNLESGACLLFPNGAIGVSG